MSTVDPKSNPGPATAGSSSSSAGQTRRVAEPTASAAPRADDEVDSTTLPTLYEPPPADDDDANLTHDLSGGDPVNSFESASILLQLDPSGRLGSGIALRPIDATETATRDLRAGHDKYQILRKVAEGGMGQIFLAHDRDLRRNVALKIGNSNTDAMRARFLEEAQVLGQLEHQNIVPMHDLGLANDRLYCTMRYLSGKTLEEVIKGLRQKDPEFSGYTLTRLVQLFLQICMAIDFAHAKGVIHRDLKPANIIVGEHGEVQVIDWGLAKVLDRASVRVEDDANRSIAGAIMGTPAYMPPEQATGNEVDERSDVYALGAILYELLCHRTPFPGKNPMDILAAVITKRPLPPRARTPDANIPEMLERIAMQAIEKDPADRPQSARTLHDSVQAWLEDEADRAKRLTLANQRTEAGRHKLAESRLLRQEVEELSAQCMALRSRFKPWQTVSEKEDLYSTEDRIEAGREALSRTESETVALLTEALGFVPDHAGARSTLAEYYRERFLKLDDGDRNNRESLRFYGRMLSVYDDGTYAREIQGNGSLELNSDPPGATAFLYRLEEHELQLRPQHELALGPTPIKLEPLEMGSYLVVLKKAGYRDVRYPVWISRNRAWSGTVKLQTDSQIGAGYLYIPAGPCILGGDPDRRVVSLPRSEPHIKDFFIAQHPVTMDEYLEFLNSLSRTSIDEAFRRSPRKSNGTSFMDRSPTGGLKLPDERTKGARCEGRWPVFGISWHDAQAYCAWRSKQEGRLVRLPTEPEWEKAVRGVDGRFYPWGHRFDASLCNMRESGESNRSPVPIDEFPTDVSVYGVRGAAGNVRDWTSSEATDGEGPKAREMRVVRGGAWNGTADTYSRCASHYTAPPTLAIDFIGMRLVASPV